MIAPGISRIGPVARARRVLIAAGLTALAFMHAAGAQGAAESQVPAREATEGLYDEAGRALLAGQHARAIPLLEEVVRRMPAHAGAWLDLGIAHCGIGNRRQAEEAFAHVLSTFGPSEAIRGVIAHYRATGCAATAGAAGVRWQWRLGGGYASNVNQGLTSLDVELGPPGDTVPVRLTEDFLPRSDAFVSGDFGLRVPLGAGGGWDLEASLRARKYARLADFDSLQAYAGVSRRWRRGDWEGDAQAGVTALGVGGRRFQQGAGLGASAWSRVGDRLWAGIEASAVAFHYPTLDAYGSRIFTTNLLLRRELPGWRIAGAIGWVADRAGRRPGGDRSGPLATLHAQAALDATHRFDLSLVYRALDDNRPYSEALFGNRTRAQRQSIASAAIERRLGSDRSLRLEFVHVRTSDVLPIFAYRANVLALSWGYNLR